MTIRRYILQKLSRRLSGLFTSYWPAPQTCEATEEALAEACRATEANPEEEFEPGVETGSNSRRPAAVSVHSRDHPEAKRVEPAGKRNCKPSLLPPHLLLQVGQISLTLFQPSLSSLSTTVSPARPPAALPSLVEDTEFADVVNGIPTNKRPLLRVRNVNLMSSGIR